MNDWFPTLERRAGPKVRLLCLPFAGGGSLAFRDWQEELGDAIEVWAACPPARERRLSQAVPETMDAFLDALEAAAQGVFRGPWAVFGHSFGALVAHALVRRRLQRGEDAPSLLAVSGSRPPWLEPLPPILHDLPSEALREELRRLGGMPPQLLDDPELMALFEPALRGDLKLSETWHLPEMEPLELPLLVLGGRDDDEALPERLAAWEQAARAGCEQELFPGGHFYVQSARGALLDRLRRALLGE